MWLPTATACICHLAKEDLLCWWSCRYATPDDAQVALFFSRRSGMEPLEAKVGQQADPCASALLLQLLALVQAAGDH